MDRGILSTAYAKPTKSGTTQAEVIDVLKAKYAGENFVQVVDELPATKDVSGTNHCHITARIVQGRVVVLSVIDNLIKGASGAAVQNFNVINGYDEHLGLT
jgi:N-acetyl-gamma-glutamyl-phosphate reductase